MASPQRENGFTGIAHEILEALMKVKLNATQLQIVLAVLRFTYGFNRKNTNHANAFFANALGIDRSNFIRDMKALQKMNIITVIRKGSGSNPSIIAFNKDYDSWAVEWKAKPKTADVKADTGVKNAPESVKDDTGNSVKTDKNTCVGDDTQERKTKKEKVKEKIRENNADANPSRSFSSLGSDKSDLSDKTKGYGTYGWVVLSDTQHFKLIDDFDEAKVNHFIEIVNERVQANGNKYGYTDWDLIVRRAIKDKWGGEWSSQSSTQADTQSLYDEYNQPF